MAKVSLPLITILLALVCFVIASVASPINNPPNGRINFTALGLTFLTITALLTGWA